MAKRVNKRVVGVLTAAGFLIVTGTGVVLVGSMQKTDPAHWSKLAEASESAEDWEQAKYYYFRAHKVSRDPAYLVHAGEMEYRGGDERTAYLAWNEAITLDPQLVPAHEKIIDLNIELAEMYRRSSGWRRVKESADALLEVDDQNSKGLFALGCALLELPSADGGDRPGGMEHVGRSVHLAPENVDYSLKLIGYMLAEGRNDDAQRGLERLVERNSTPGPDASRVHWSYGRYLSAMKRYEQAGAAFEKAETLAGNDRAALAAAKSQHAQFWTGRWYSGISDSAGRNDIDEYFDKASALLHESLELDADGFLQAMLLAELVAYRGEYLEAIEICETRIGSGIRRDGLKATGRKYALYRLLLKTADLCLAHSGTLKIDSADYDAIVAKAEQFCLEAESEMPDLGPALHSMGKVKLAQGDELEAIKHFQRSREARGRMMWQNDKMLAQLLLRHNQPGAALEAINNTLADPKADPSCWVIAANAALAANDPATALRRANEALRRAPGDLHATRAKITALRKLGQGEVADSLAQTIIEDSPADLVFQAHLLDTEGRTDQALKLLGTLLEQEPDHIAALRLAVDILVRRDEHDKAMSLVNNAMAKSPGNHEVILLSATADKNLSDEERRIAQQEAISKIEDPFQRFYQLAIIFGRNNMLAEYIDAINTAEEHLNAPGNNLGRALKRRYLRDIYERQFLVAIKSQDTTTMERVVNKAAESNIDGAAGLTFRGRLQMYSGETELALSTLKDAIGKQPADAATLAYIGQCHMSFTPPQIFESRLYFERAADANPNLYAAQKGLAMIARMNGDQSEFLARLERLAELSPDDPWVEEQLQAQREIEAPLEGIERRLLIKSRDPNDLQNLLVLASLYAKTDQRTEAAQCYETVLALPDAGTSAVMAATNFYRAIGNNTRALQLLERLVEQALSIDQKAEMVLLIATHWYGQGNRAEAEAALKRAAELRETIEVCTAFARFKTSIGEYDSAIEWYDRAINHPDRPSPELATQLLRNRIDILFRSERYEEARGEVRSYLEKHPKDQKGLLMRSVLATVSGDIDQAISHLDQYLETKPSEVNALLQRAGLYLSQGRNAAAIKDLEQLRRIDPKAHNYTPRMLLSDGYVLTERPELAYQELEPIIRQDPTATRVALHLINLYRDNDRYSDATRVCTSMANRYPDQPLWYKTRGDIKARLGERTLALSDYQRSAKLSDYNPLYVAPLLQAYVRFERPNDGLTYYTKMVPAGARSAMVTMRYAELLAGAGQRDESVVQFLAAFRAAGFDDLGFIRQLVGAVISSFGQQDAIDLFRTEPANPEFKRTAQHLLAMLLNHFDNSSEALAEMKKLLDTALGDAERTTLLAAVGNIHERQENWESARDAYERLLKINDTHMLGLNNLAFLLSDKLHRSSEALPYARKVVKLYPLHSVRDTLAWVLVQSGEYREAIAILTRLLRDQPRYLPGIYHLAEAYRRNGESRKARDLLEEALNLPGERLGEKYRAKMLASLEKLDQGDSAP